ncbi:MAG: phospholipid carrier-dependent glycosyltransferase, partial [Desulfosarcina sp.]|nr:phospholipid carrier-dependent glycosyltransferase [Desulfobacterales bacterium]
MKIINNLKLPFLILALSGIASSLFFPYFPIDETRYLSVAWEMKLHHSFVPLLNALPYSHKPPFLFLLINLDWLIFGTNEQTLRLIPLFFSVLNILMTYRIALALWEDKKIARYATAILASTLIYLTWSTLIMFDVILTFWVLVGIYGLLTATRSNIKTSIILVGLSIGGGLLTKGPVIFVHVLPTGILYFLWRSKDRPEAKKWYLMILLSIFIGLALSLLWAVPAAIKGGEAYGEALLWGQTVGRLTSSFAPHQRPIWWYVP